MNAPAKENGLKARRPRHLGLGKSAFTYLSNKGAEIDVPGRQLCLDRACSIHHGWKAISWGSLMAQAEAHQAQPPDP
jgi:hypothetical protein